MGIYSNLETKYYKLVETLDGKGIPIRSITDPIEGAGLPSMPVLAGVLMVILALGLFLIIPAPMVNINVAVTANGIPLQGATLFALGSEYTTDSSGMAEVELPLGSQELGIEKEGCDLFEEIIDGISEITKQLIKLVINYVLFQDMPNTR